MASPAAWNLQIEFPFDRGHGDSPRWGVAELLLLPPVVDYHWLRLKSKL